MIPIFILLAMLAGLLGLAKRRGNGRRRRPNFNNYLSANIDLDDSLTTLGAKTLTSIPTLTVIDTTRISSIRNTYTLSDFTPGANIGPILVGVSHSDYSDAEIEGFIESSNGWDMSNLIAREIRQRRIRMIGTFNTPSAASDSTRLNDGRPIRTKLNWIVAEGQGLRFWAYNMGNQAVATTVPNFHIFGNANLWRHK